MKKNNRYQTSHLVENQYEPQSHGLVLKNLLSIKNKREMDRIELLKLEQAEAEAFQFYEKNLSAEI